MKKTILLTSLMLVLIGCATTANYEKKLNTWVGATELELVRTWGVPEQVYETGGQKFLVYTSSRRIWIQGTPPSYTATTIGNTTYKNRTGGSPDQEMELNCRTTFELENDKVISWNWKGNDCLAPE